MSPAYRFQAAISVAALLILTAPLVHADICRWDTGEVIPGTEGIEPEPGVQLDHINLGYARILELDTAAPNFEASEVAEAALVLSTLTDPDFSQTNVTGWDLSEQDLKIAIFREVMLAGANLEASNLVDTNRDETVSPPLEPTDYLSHVRTDRAS